MAGNRFIRFLGRLISTAAMVGVAIMGYNMLKKSGMLGGNDNPGESIQPPPVVSYQLACPKNLSFDPQSCVLSWQAVDDASGYRISYNDTLIEVEAKDTSAVMTIVHIENVFKIMAVGDNLPYTDSVWSEPITYTMDLGQDMSLYNRVNLALAQAVTKKGMQLVDVVGITIAKVGKIDFQTICETDEGMQNVLWVYNSHDENILQMFENFSSENIKCVDSYDIVDFEAAEALLKSKSFDGQMEELRTQGYTISVVDSCVRKGLPSGNDFVFDIVGTYKAELGEDVKIFSSVNRIKVIDASKDDESNYVLSTMVKRYRTVTETYFVMHEEGATLEYMQELVDNALSIEAAAMSREYASIPTTYYRGKERY